MPVCPKNACAGGYGNCLDVKITNQCNAACAFCIERGGYSPAPDKTPTELAIATVAQKDFPTVLILGGEPTLYPGLIEYLQLIRPYKKHIYMTTNGLLLHALNLPALATLLNGVNISLHHYDPAVNDEILSGGPGKPKKVRTDLKLLRQAVDTLTRYGCPVRINCNLTRQGIHTDEDIRTMCFLAAWLGATSIRFTELQNASDDDFIGADEFFDDLPEDPFTDGCEVTLPNQYGLPLQVIVKVTCGRVNCRKPPVTEQPVRTGVTRVLYPNGEVSHGWKTARTDNCHTGGCHGPSMQTGGCHSDGCH